MPSAKLVLSRATGGGSFATVVDKTKACKCYTREVLCVRQDANEW